MVYSSHDFKIKASPLADGFDFATVGRYPSGSGAPPLTTWTSEGGGGESHRSKSSGTVWQALSLMMHLWAQNAAPVYLDGTSLQRAADAWHHILSIQTCLPALGNVSISLQCEWSLTKSLVGTLLGFELDDIAKIQALATATWLFVFFQIRDLFIYVFLFGEIIL